MVQHTGSPDSFGFAIAALALITLDLKKGEKIKYLLFKVI